MKKIVSFFVLVSLLLLSSCKSERKSAIEIEGPHMSLNKADTTEVTKLANEFINCLRQNDIDGAMSMIHFLDKDSIVALPVDLAKQERDMLSSFKGVSYDLDRMIFDEEIDNEVKIIVTLFEKEATDPRPNTIYFVLKPVRRNDKWYLTLADSLSDTNNLRGTNK